MLQQLFAGSTESILALLGLILPHVASLVTGSKWLPHWAGGYVTIFFSAVIGFFGQWALADNPHGYNWAHAASVAGTTFVFAILSLIGVHNRTPVKDVLDAKLVGDVYKVDDYVDASSLVATPPGRHEIEQTSMPRPKPSPN